MIPQKALLVEATATAIARDLQPLLDLGWRVAFIGASGRDYYTIVILDPPNPEPYR